MIQSSPRTRNGRLKLRWRRIVIASGVTFAVMLISGCGSSTETTTSQAELIHAPPERVVPRMTDSPAPGEDNLRPVKWRLAEPPTTNLVHLYSGAGYCVGEPPPEYQMVRVIERGRRVFITSYVQEPRPTRRALCRGIGGFQRGIVKLRQDASKVRLYDASTSPPVSRWPQVK
jgi:hypothetical protein